MNTHSQQIIRAQRINTIIWISSLFVLVIGSFIFLNNLMGRFENLIQETRMEFKPVITKTQEVLDHSKTGIDSISASGSDLLSSVNPRNLLDPANENERSKNVAVEIEKSWNRLNQDYVNTRKNLDNEYRQLKKDAGKEYSDFKHDYRQFKEDLKTVKKDIMQEIINWRIMITFFLSVFSILLLIISIKDIMENARWFITFFKSFLKKDKTIKP